MKRITAADLGDLLMDEMSLGIAQGELETILNNMTGQFPQVAELIARHLELESIDTIDTIIERLVCFCTLDRSLYFVIKNGENRTVALELKHNMVYSNPLLTKIVFEGEEQTEPAISTQLGADPDEASEIGVFIFSKARDFQKMISTEEQNRMIDNANARPYIDAVIAARIASEE